MSQVLLEGFEDGLFAQRWAASTGASVYTGPRIRNGACSMLVDPTSTSDFARYNIPAAKQHATMIVGFGWMVPLGTPRASNTALIEFLGDAGVTSHISMKTSATGVITLLRGATVIATSAAGVLVQNGSWNYVEVKVVLDDTVGVAECRVNEVVVCTFTGDTKNAGTGTVIDQVRWGILSSTANAYVDDVYIVNGDSSGVNSYMGDIAIEYIIPNGNGTNSAFVGSDGNSVNNYQLVDDNLMVDYVESSTPGAQDSYAMTDLSRANGTILGVQSSVLMQKTDSGVRGMKPTIVKSGITYEAPEVTLSTAMLVVDTVWEKDPATVVAWTVAGVNAVELGVKVGT